MIEKKKESWCDDGKNSVGILELFIFSYGTSITILLDVKVSYPTNLKHNVSDVYKISDRKTQEWNTLAKTQI